MTTYAAALSPALVFPHEAPAETVYLDGEIAWQIYSSGQMPLDDAFDLAAGIECADGVWSLNCDANGAAAALLTFGDDIYDLRHTDKVAWFARLGAYDRVREALEALWPCMSGNVTDPWAAETFSDLYKCDNGCRPSMSFTGAYMRDWIKTRDAE